MASFVTIYREAIVEIPTLDLFILVVAVALLFALSKEVRSKAGEAGEAEEEGISVMEGAKDSLFSLRRPLNGQIKAAHH